MAHQLTAGSVNRIVNGETGFTPTLQVLDVKRIVTGQQGERYRLVLSDGEWYMQGMLGTAQNELVKQNNLAKWSVIQLEEFVSNNINGKKICVVIKCHTLQHMSNGIGKPKNIFQKHAPAGAPRNNPPRPPPPPQQVPFHQRHNMNNNNNNNNMNNNMNRSGYNNNNRGNYNNHNSNRSNSNTTGSNSSYFNSNNNRASNSSTMHVQPVSSLNPYQNNWKIQVRCTQKDSMRHWHNQRGEGKLFKVDLLDKQGTEIQAVAFNEAAEKFFPVFQVNKVYYISRGQVRMAKKNYTHIKNDYSITLNADAEVVPVEHDVQDIATQKYKFVSIQDVGNAAPKSFVDVIGVIMEVGPLGSVMSNRMGKELKRRNIKIADESAKIDVTLWNEDAENFDEDKGQGNIVVALKAAKVSEFGGRSLTANTFDFNPERPEATRLIEWMNRLGGNIRDVQLNEMTTGVQGVSANAPRLTLQQARDQKLGENTMDRMSNKKHDYFTTIATVTTITHGNDKKIWYESNPDVNDEHSKAKVYPVGDGKWRCEKNGKVYDGYRPRYILRFCVSDATSNMWMSAFDEVATKILKKTATEAEKLMNEDPQSYEQMFTDATFQKYVFRVKAWSEVWEDSVRTRYEAVGVQMLDYVKESEKLLETIEYLQRLKNGQLGNANMNGHVVGGGVGGGMTSVNHNRNYNNNINNNNQMGAGMMNHNHVMNQY